MLVLSRKLGEKVFIGDNICITVVDGHGKIRLGIDCPRSIPIERDENVLPDDPRRQACVTHVSTATITQTEAKTRGG